MADTWSLNDSAPAPLGSEFAAPAAAGAFALNDSAPASLGQAFASPAPPWAVAYWSPATLVFDDVVTSYDYATSFTVGALTVYRGAL